MNSKESLVSWKYIYIRYLKETKPITQKFIQLGVFKYKGVDIFYPKNKQFFVANWGKCFFNEDLEFDIFLSTISNPITWEFIKHLVLYIYKGVEIFCP